MQVRQECVALFSAIDKAKSEFALRVCYNMDLLFKHAEHLDPEFEDVQKSFYTIVKYNLSVVKLLQDSANGTLYSEETDFLWKMDWKTRMYQYYEESPYDKMPANLASELLGEGCDEIPPSISYHVRGSMFLFYRAVKMFERPDFALSCIEDTMRQAYAIMVSHKKDFSVIRRLVAMVCFNINRLDNIIDMYQDISSQMEGGEEKEQQQQEL